MVGGIQMAQEICPIRHGRTIRPNRVWKIDHQKYQERVLLNKRRIISKCNRMES
jgi:hypothetical protein